jgi:hypothetical protein
VKQYLALLLAFCTQLALAAGADEWATAISRRPSDGWQIVSRYVERFVVPVSKANYPFAVVVRWRYESPNGMPSPLEQEAMYELEDLLARHLEKGRQAVWVRVQTGNNSRSWTYYARTETGFREAAKLALQPASRFPVQATVARDENWLELERFRQGVRTK